MPVRWGGRCRGAAGRVTVAGGRPGPAHGDRHAGWLWRSVVLVEGLAPRSWGASTPMKMCIQAVLDGTGALRHMNKNNSERPVCTTHPLAPISTSFLFVFDTEWVMST